MHPIEHIDLINICIGVGIKKHIDLARTLTTAVGGDVIHPRGAVDLLLQRTCHSTLNGDRIRTRQIGGDLNRGRRNIGKVLDRQQRQRNHAGHQDQNAAHGAEHRAADKRIGKTHRPLAGNTLPLRIWAKLPSTTLSPIPNPLSTG